MAATLTIVDATPSGRTLGSFRLELVSERIAVRDLIKERVLHEVAERNRAAREPATVRSAAEALLNGPPRPRKPIDGETACAQALEAFQRNGFFLFVGDRQVEDLDEEIAVGPGTEVRFVKLVPLAGG